MKRFLLCAALIAWSSGMASAVVYKWVDAQGKVHYGDRPPDGVHAEIVELLGTRAPRAASPAPLAGNAALAKAPMTTTPGEAAAAARKTVDSDVAQSKEKQCAEAQDFYKKLIEGRKLYKSGTDGERQYLTSDEIDQARMNAKASVDTACNSPT